VSRAARSALLALPALLVGCSTPDELPLPGTLARERIELAAEAAEPVIAWQVAEGQRVTAGTVLLELDPARAEAAVARAAAARDRARRKLDELTRGPRRETVQELQARYDGAEQQLSISERELARVRDLMARKLASDADLDRAAAARDAARTTREAARAQLAAALKGSTIEELDQARASLAEAEAARRDAEVTLARLTVVAPVDGVVDELPFHPGERPAPGQPVAVLLGDARVYARVFVPEPLRARVTVGTEAVVRVDGIERPFDGKVRYVASEAAYTPYYSLTEHDRSRLAYRAEVDLTMDADTAKLPSGVPVDVDFPSLH
jgi:HlyD family secretion protein